MAHLLALLAHFGNLGTVVEAPLTGKRKMSTEIERKSLEAHVELCAERYKQMNDKLESLETRTSKIETILNDIKSKVFSNENKNTERLLKWSTAVIAFLITLIIGFGGHYVNKLERSLEHMDSKAEQRNDLKK